ncbi:phosphonate ABC transporter, permease protein PhnE [Ammoniphilus sp. YIM 78166]|uniref:phosphonate ABC transporter, permease protein PhnE n=1 Tax=Ammoniphilus sp. YIM 78166 TaxID=1644106 RepID=UPI001F0D8D23|nr:phosphonate ABC transporter, permease protein PhnE [Ammoniphilus sp. YIM 78166]
MNRLTRGSLTFLSAIIIVWSAYGTEFDLGKFFDLGNSFVFLQSKWLPPDWTVLIPALKAAVITLQIAIMGTFLAILVALPLSFLAAYNTSPSLFVYNGTRWLLNLFRSIPEIVLGLLLVPSLGLGPFPAVIAIAIHNIGVLGKLIAELIEAADEGPQEAVKSVGASRLFVILYGILPQIIPNILSNYFYRLEVGVRASLILGFIGGGGIGNMLFIDFKIFNYSSVATEVLVIMLLVIAVDYLGTFVRKRVI